jgi:cytochrome c-type biogenesis protein CcmH
MSTVVGRLPDSADATALWRRVVGALSSRIGWALLVAVVVAAVSIGSVHPAPATLASRIAYLDNLIKCPVCDDVSIAASDAQSAVSLRAKVAELVDVGDTNAQVEAYVVARYGTDELLRPTSPVIWILPIAAGAIATASVTTVLVRRRKGSAATTADAADELLVAAALGRDSP